MCVKRVCVCLIMCQKTVYAFANEKVFVTVRICMFKVSVKSVCMLLCICAYVKHVKSLYFCVNLFEKCVCVSVSVCLCLCVCVCVSVCMSL